MAKIANVALTNTFDFWRTQSNISFDRLSQFAINNSRLYANTVVANNVLKSLGNTVIGASGKRAVVNGLLSANGRVTISTNLNVTGNTSANKSTVTSSLTVSGNTTLGAAGKRTIVTGLLSANGRVTVSGNTIVSYVDMGSASYSSISLSVIAQDSAPSSLFFSPDGLKMFMLGRANDKVYQYNLSTPWVVSSASFVTDFSVTSQTTFPQGIYFKPDGLKFFVVGSTPDEVFQYSLTTPWTISTASYDSISFSVATEDTSPQGIDFSSDGINMYVCGSDSDGVYQYLLSTPWAISTATYVRTLSVTGQETVPNSLRFTYDGTRLFLLGQTGDDINWYDLSTPWNISTAVHQSQFSVAAQETAPQSLYVQPNGETFYIAGQTNSTVYQYAMPLVSINLTGDTNLNGNVDIYQNATVAGVATFAAGSVAAPAITTSGDTNTGIFFPAADTIAFGEGGAEAMRIGSSGLITACNSMTVGTNLSVSGNTSLSAGASNTFVNFNGARLSNFSEFANTAINTGSAKTVSNDTNFVRYTVSAGCTITLPTNSGNPGASPAVKSVVLFLKQNGTGGYAVTLAAPAGGAIKYNNSATQPAVNTTANKVTIYSCMKFDNDNTWYVSQSFIDA